MLPGRVLAWLPARSPSGTNKEQYLQQSTPTISLWVDGACYHFSRRVTKYLQNKPQTYSPHSAYSADMRSEARKNDGTPVVRGAIAKGVQSRKYCSVRSRAARRRAAIAMLSEKVQTIIDKAYKLSALGRLVRLIWLPRQNKQPKNRNGAPARRRQRNTRRKHHTTHIFLYMLRSFTIDDSNFAAIAERQQARAAGRRRDGRRTHSGKATAKSGTAGEKRPYLTK